MLDFVTPVARKINGQIVVCPEFNCQYSKDLMVRGKAFYAIWDEAQKIWCTNELDARRLIDEDLWAYKIDNPLVERVSSLKDFSTKQWVSFLQYIKNLPDNFVQLDSKVIFQNTDVKREDYASKRLPYSLSDAPCPSYDKIMSTLYSPEERQKIEWAIGAIFTGDAKSIQKFFVLFGAMGTGKSTVLNIIQMLFEGYFTTFDAKALGMASQQFSTEAFRSNPLVAIQHDGDLSKIEDNTRLNSIISHEYMTMHEKFKSSYTARSNAFIFMGTNSPVKISDSRSGLIRRLVDIHPTGATLPIDEYDTLMENVKFELGGIASKCMHIFKKLGRNYYKSYIPFDMMYKTDPFFNFMEANYFIFKKAPYVSLTQGYDMYKEYCSESGQEHILPRHKFRDEFSNYFTTFEKMGVREDGTRARSLYSGFRSSMFEDYASSNEESGAAIATIELANTRSLLDDILADCPAQYANEDDKPTKKWNGVKTKLRDLDTTRVHYVKPPENHIVIDIDLKNEKGEKDAQKCLSEATKWPLTYAEFSKGGQGVHLHYNYAGDVSRLSRVYSDGVEIKVFTGNSSLRRRLSYCNDCEVATLSGGLPLKEEPVIDFEVVKSEKSLRKLIERNLRKEIHPGTKPSMDFIAKILNDAYNSDLHYDISDMKQSVLVFASRSTNHAQYCIGLMKGMHFQSRDIRENVKDADGEIIFYDVEVFPNLFLVNWKQQGTKECVRMINPTPQEVEGLFSKKLIGFNCRRYDNHILYARYLGYSNEDLYDLSQRIIGNKHGGMIGEAYNVSYADIFDFCTVKQSLKKWEIALGIHHQELGLPWDQPVPEERWVEVAEYCDNDVFATEAVFNARQEDFVARQILADLAGGTVNDTTQTLAGKFIFGNDPRPQDKFVYTDLSTIFPGYKYEFGKSSYRGEDPKEGGYVYSEPGMYFDVALLDIASMHPTSIEQLNLFGPYTQRFSELKQARVYIKHGELDEAKKLLGGVLTPYLDSGKYSNSALAYALKILINSIYGFTSAKFDNKFRDKRNKDNIVAKRGALFMIDLKHAVQEQGFTVAHIKTDSIKIPNATPEIIEFVKEFGKRYGYSFEHEATYSQMCLVNDAVYIAKYLHNYDKPDLDGSWTATGAQFAQPYVFKTLFSKEPIDFKDMCETKSVTTAMYLDMNENLGEDEHDYQFIGKAGQFTPIRKGCGGGILYREGDGKYAAVVGTKGYRWLESEVVEKLGKQDDVDRDYYNKLVDEAVADISKFGDFELFTTYEHSEVPF